MGSFNPVSSDAKVPFPHGEALAAWTGAASAAAEAADSDPPITEKATAPPNISGPARRVRQYFPNPVMEQNFPLSGCGGAPGGIFHLEARHERVTVCQEGSIAASSASIWGIQPRKPNRRQMSDSSSSQDLPRDPGLPARDPDRLQEEIEHRGEREVGRPFRDLRLLGDLAHRAADVTLPDEDRAASSRICSRVRRIDLMPMEHEALHSTRTEAAFS